ncbi:hypothetical protein [Fundidesulfovibrio agrisoli]|uniref:hypothetical protein n=1 Tax=Fundidesulfovibrio agrisoli TaxID=2922717 RepID=UPI001FABAB4A|nr:hypothetical protein [Fundidesulfovibrio agrisoli]
MITYRDISYLSKLAPVAQLLELLGQQEHPAVRSPEVFLSMARDIWEVYGLLSSRLSDEAACRDEALYGAHYYDRLEMRVREALKELL